MATDITKAAVVAHFEALFPDPALVVVTPLRNNENPEPPRKEADLAKTQVYLQFPPHKEEAVCLGSVATPWRETGAFLFHVLVASGKADAAADAAFKTITLSLRNQTIGGRVDILSLFGAESGPRFGGNWWGKSSAVEYEVEDV